MRHNPYVKKSKFEALLDVGMAQEDYIQLMNE
jgi:hypothetical protein